MHSIASLDVAISLCLLFRLGGLTLVLAQRCHVRWKVIRIR
jgi:hypothetical protein